MPAKPTPAASESVSISPTSTASAPSPAKPMPAQDDCKPQTHKKTGVTMPCPAPD